MKTLIISLCVISLILFAGSNTAYAQSCSPPENFMLAIDNSMFSSSMFWYPSFSGCPTLYYELEYGYSPFTPGTGAATLISPLYENYFVVYDPYVTDAWVRAVCDCNPMGEPDGIPDDFSTWVQASIYYVPPPNFPDPGMICEQAPVEPVRQDFECGSSFGNLDFDGQFAALTYIPCTDEEEYVLYRSFIAPPGFIVEITMSEYTGWNDFGLLILEGGCSGPIVHCIPSFTSQETLVIDALVPGQLYTIECWNNNFYYYFDWQNGFSYGAWNSLNICEPASLCNYPTNPGASQMTDHTALLNWSENMSSEWRIEYGPAGFTPGTGMFVEEILDEPYLLTGLESLTPYEYYVNAVCGEYISSSAGPFAFSTQPSIWLISQVPNDHTFCCDNIQLSESINIGAYCDSIYFTYTDSYMGSGCEYLIERTVTAHDTCGNELSQSFTMQVEPNDIPCDCDHELAIGGNSAGNAVAISGNWAVYEAGVQDKVYYLDNGEWTYDSSIELGNNSHSTLDMDGDVIVSANRVFRLSGNVWIPETVLQSSMGDISANAAAVHGNTIALGMNGRIFIFEYVGVWTEVAMFDQPCASLDLTDDLLVSGLEEVDYIGHVFRNTTGVWDHEQGLQAFGSGSGQEAGYDVAIQDDRLAIGHRWVGGLYTYYFDGELWGDGNFLTNPFLYSNIGYYSAFGSSLDINGNIMVVGDFMNQPNGGFSGSVVVYEWLCGDWVAQRNIVPVNGNEGQRFGGAVSLDASNMIVGIDNTYWLGGHPYTGVGKYWFYNCLGVDPSLYTITAGNDQSLTCNEEIPAPDFLVGPGFCENAYEITITEEGNAICGSEIVRTYSVSDEFGNAAQTSQTFSFIDDVEPEIVSAPQDITIGCGEVFETTEPVFLDNCSSEIVVAFSEALTTDECGTHITQTWTASDACSNTAVVNRIIHQLDLDAPTVVFAPTDLTIQCDEVFETIDPVFADDCSEALDIDFSEETIGDNCYSQTEQTWIATDACGNMSTVLRTVTRTDADSPVIVNCEPVLTLYIPAGSNSIGMPDLLVDLDAIDNCSSTISIEQSITTNDALAVGTYFVYLTATDECDNETICEVVVTVDQESGILDLNQSSMQLYPNPVHDFLNVSLIDDGLSRYEILDASGKIVLSGEQHTRNFTIDISLYSAGIYQFRLIGMKGTICSKLVITD